MPTYEYRCKECDSVYESETPADAVECWTKDCDGQAKRVWAVNLHRENIRAVPRG